MKKILLSLITMVLLACSVNVYATCPTGGTTQLNGIVYTGSIFTPIVGANVRLYWNEPEKAEVLCSAVRTDVNGVYAFQNVASTGSNSFYRLAFSAKDYFPTSFDWQDTDPTQNDVELHHQ